jgi:hypothetical protein
LGRRALYAAGWPLIPLVRLHRIRDRARRAGLADALFLRVLPVLFAGLSLASAGEGLGYLLGGGDALRAVASMELHRRPLLLPGEPTYPQL